MSSLSNELCVSLCGSHFFSSNDRKWGEEGFYTLTYYCWIHGLVWTARGIKGRLNQFYGGGEYTLKTPYFVLEIWDGIKSKTICKDTKILLCHESIPQFCEVNVAGKLVFLKFSMNDRVSIVYGDIDLGKTWHSLLIEFWNKTWLMKEAIIFAWCWPCCVGIKWRRSGQGKHNVCCWRMSTDAFHHHAQFVGVFRQAWTVIMHANVELH